MELFSSLLALCAGNSPVSGDFPAQRTVTRSFDIFFDLRLNKRLSKQSWGWWFEMPSRPLWLHCNAIGNWHDMVTMKPCGYSKCLHNAEMTPGKEKYVLTAYNGQTFKYNTSSFVFCLVNFVPFYPSPNSNLPRFTHSKWLTLSGDFSSNKIIVKMQQSICDIFSGFVYSVLRSHICSVCYNKSHTCELSAEYFTHPWRKQYLPAIK